MHNCRFHGSSKHTRTSRIFRQTRCEANYTLKPRAYLGTRVRVTQTQLGLLQHAVAQQLHVVGEVEADTTDDFADSLVRAARNRQVLLDGSAQLRINHAQRELTILLALGQVVVQEVLHPQTYTAWAIRLQCAPLKSPSSSCSPLTRKSADNSCSVTAVMFSNALSADSNGENADNFTTRWKREKSWTPRCTSCTMAPISSLSRTSNRAHPDEDSNNV